MKYYHGDPSCPMQESIMEAKGKIEEFLSSLGPWWQGSAASCIAAIMEHVAMLEERNRLLENEVVSLRNEMEYYGQPCAQFAPPPINEYFTKGFNDAMQARDFKLNADNPSRAASIKRFIPSLGAESILPLLSSKAAQSVILGAKDQFYKGFDTRAHKPTDHIIAVKEEPDDIEAPAKPVEAQPDGTDDPMAAVHEVIRRYGLPD